MAKKIPTKSMIETVNHGAAAVDIGSRMHMAAVNPDATDMPVRAFGTQARSFTPEAMAQGAYSDGCRDGRYRAVEFTSSRQGDSPLLPELLAQIPAEEDIGTVTADGAYDTRRCHSAIMDRGADAVIPIRKNGRTWKEDGSAAAPRNEILRATRRLGRALWKKGAGYHVRSRVEAKMNCTKAFGERIMRAMPKSW